MAALIRQQSLAVFLNLAGIQYTLTRIGIAIKPDKKMNALHPKKLLLTKWTAVKSIDKNKHFLVLKVIEPELPETV